MSGKKGCKSLKKIVSKFEIIGIDTNIFIYYLNRNSQYHQVVENIFILFAKQKYQILTSTLTLTELLSFKTTEAASYNLEKEFLSIFQFLILDVSRGIASQAARIRRKYDFHLVDSIQLATALEGKAKAFITNDKRLKKFKELKVLLVSEL